MILGWKNVGHYSLAIVVAGSMLTGTGCSRTDPDTLAAIAHKLADRTQFVSDNLEHAWTKVSGRVVLESRVKNRLHWDKTLADVSIEVHATDSAVELKGTLPSQAQVRRAVELAESTLGVDKVINALQIEKQ